MARALLHRLVVGLLAVSLSLAQLLTYTENTTDVFSVTGASNGCYSPLGSYPHWCLGNISRCSDGLSVSVWIKSRSDVTPERDPDVILTSGGHNLNGNGFFITRKYADQYTVGVAVLDKRWTASVRLEPGSWTMVSFSWEKAAGLSLYIDGFFQTQTKDPELRAVVPASDGSSSSLLVGLTEQDEPVTSACTYEVGRITVVNTQYVTSSLPPDLNTTKQLYQGCVNVNVVNQTKIPDASKADPGSFCRLHCNQLSQTFALVFNGTSCACANTVNATASSSSPCDGKWSVYAVTHVKTGHPYRLVLDSAAQSRLPYTKPGEDILFSASIGYSIPAIYRFEFDDLIVVTTAAPPVSHSWDSAGQHAVVVTSQVGVIRLTASLRVTVEDVDEGTPPDLLGLTLGHGVASLTAECALRMFDSHPTACGLAFGDGVLSPPYSFLGYGLSHDMGHVYDRCGHYTVKVNCTNDYGNKTAQLEFWARQMQLSHQYLGNVQDFVLETTGGSSFYKSLYVGVNHTGVNFTVLDTGAVKVDMSDLDPGSDNLVSLISDGVTLDRHVLSIRSPVPRPLISADRTSGAWNLTAKLTITLSPTDHLWVSVDYGNGAGRLVYVPEVGSSLRVDDSAFYGNLGDYTVTVALDNEVSAARNTLEITVQVPVDRVTVLTRNITSLRQNATFEISINNGSVGPLYVNFLVSFGDGSVRQFFYENGDRGRFQPYVLNYTYTSWGIYGVKVAAFNNISQAEAHAFIHVGENITFLDIRATNERIPLGGIMELTILCPTGSNVQYKLDFGDGSNFTVGELTGSTASPNSNVSLMTEGSVVVNHVYAKAGYYNVKVTASNEFGWMRADLCPTLVVSQPSVPLCGNLSLRIMSTSEDKPLVRKRSSSTALPVDASLDCAPSLAPKVNMTFSWKGVSIEYDADRNRLEKSINVFCGFGLLDPSLRLEPLSLPYGLYKLTVTASPLGHDMLYASDSFNVRIIQSEPVPVIAGDPVRTIMLYATAIFDISGSGDPDLDSDTRRDVAFHLFFVPETSLKSVQKLTLPQMISSTEQLTNRTLFRTTTSNYFAMYQFGQCFNSTSRLADDLSTSNGKITFAADNFATNQFSLAAMLWAERNGLSAMTYQIVEIRSSNASLDDLGSLLDLAKNADPDTAIRLLGGAASAILNQDTSSAEVQEKLAESTEAVVSTLGSVAKRIDSPNQAAKCASAIKMMTSNKDIVNEGSRSSAVGAFVDLANGSSSMDDVTVEDAASFAGECLGGLGNIFPTSQDEKKPTHPTTSGADETTTQLIQALSTAKSNGSDGIGAITLDTTHHAPNGTWATTPTRVAVTSTTPTPTTTTTTITTTTTTTTVVITTPQTTVIHTVVGTTLSPAVGASFVNNGDNFTISGITVGTLQLNASKDYTTPQPFSTTISAIDTTLTSTTLDPPVTLPIDERMFEPRSDTRTSYDVGKDLLKRLPATSTYSELFSYIFDDCLLFRKVMKAPEIQYNMPCLSTDAINMMRCDGEFTLQDRVFDIMTYYEHPDDIYEVYLVPLDKARNERNKARKATDQVVATSGLNALSTVAESVGAKTPTGDSTERTFSTSRLGMKLAKVKVNNGTNATDVGASEQQTLALPSGGFDVPLSVLQGSAGSCPHVNTMFLADGDNPYTYSEAVSSVGKGVLSLGYSCNGEKLAVEQTTEPIVLWMERDPDVYQHSLFVLLTNTKRNVWSNFNYHPVNITEFNSSLQVVLDPLESMSEYYVYMKYGDRPNLTHYDHIGYSPNGDAARVSGFAALNDTQKQQLSLTVTFPLELTAGNGTYWIGVRYKGGNLQLEETTANTTYTLLNLISGCRYWDETNNTWSSEGCRVGPLTTKYKTQCLCNHLTSFGADSVVAPNTIDFNNVWAKFANLSENAAVFATVISLCVLYVILLIGLRHMDKKDLVKWGAVPLEDNLPTDTYHYQVTVQTGVKRNAGTDSQVRFIVSGEDGDSGVRRLAVADGHRKTLPRGSIYNYVMSTDSCLGALTFLRVWHDNSGTGKNQSWYLDQVQICDLQTSDRFIFLCDRWLAVEEDDGMVDRILPVAGLEDLIAFKQLFSSSARKKLANDHLWVSVFSRPTRSNFTRVQRLSCCMSLLFLTMITNAMWFKGADTQTNVDAIKLGPFTFTLAQLFISFASTIIVFPPSFLMMTFFRKCRPKKNTVSQQNQPNVKDSQKFRWRNITSSTSMLWGPTPEKSRFGKLKDRIGTCLSSFKTAKYEDEGEPAADRHDSLNFLKPKKKKPWTLPHWCVYIAWTLCFFSIVASGFFTILYSMEWGKDKANEWLTTFLLSFVQSVIIVQPIKVLLLVAFIACILKKPDLEDEDLDEDINRVLANGDASDAARDETSLSQIMLQRRTDNSEFQPPDPEILAKSRETRLMEIKMEAVLKEILIYTIFLAIIFFLSYQQRDPQSYMMSNNIRQIMLGGFEEIKTVLDYWGWLEGTFLPSLYALQYANGTDVRYWRDTACISDLENRRVGVARIRQLRIKNDSCTILPTLKPFINHCRDEYNWFDDDTKPYLPFWETPPDDMIPELKKSNSPFVYQDSIKLKTAPYVGHIATYKGGGYVILTKRQYSRTAALLSTARSQNWLDLSTKAVLLEYTVYNPNSNLFTSVTAVVEFLTTGSASTVMDVKVFRLMSYIGGFGLIVLIMEVCFGVITMVFFVQCVKRVRMKRTGYFTDFWNLLEFVLLCLAVTCIVLYAFKHILTDVAMAALHNRKSDGFVNFNSIALYDEMYGFVMAGVVFMATIQFLKLLQFNKKMGMLGSTLKLASKDLRTFSITFFLYFFAFAATGFLLFGSTLTSYQDIITTTESMFAFALGSFDYKEISAAQPFWGPLFVFSYIGVVYISLMNFFLTIIGESFSQVKENVALQSNDYEIVDFMWTKIKGLFK